MLTYILDLGPDHHRNMRQYNCGWIFWSNLQHRGRLRHLGSPNFGTEHSELRDTEESESHVDVQYWIFVSSSKI
jgi:hypothetical protein